MSVSLVKRAPCVYCDCGGTPGHHLPACAITRHRFAEHAKAMRAAQRNGSESAVFERQTSLRGALVREASGVTYGNLSRAGLAPLFARELSPAEYRRAFGIAS